MKKRLAIFDIDGTIFRSSLVIQLINHFVRMGIFPKKAWSETQSDYLAWLDRKGSYENYINKVVKTYIKYIKGCKKTQVDRAVNEVISLQKDRVYRFTRDLIEKLKSKGYVLIAISGSPAYIVKGYAKSLGFTASFGTVIEEKNKIFTGKVLNTDSANQKPKVLQLYVRNSGFAVDWKNSVAIGDTESDISMLSMVGRPIAFNPNLKLTKHALKNQWQIVVERKDVVFEIEKFNFLKIK